MTQMIKGHGVNYLDKDKDADKARARFDWGRFWQVVRDVVARASLPVLALAASYGVYSFSSRFVPEFFAWVTAGAFESVYLGLAVARNLDERQRVKARWISGGAVAVSVSFNWTSGVLDTLPADQGFKSLDFWLKFGLAALHGLPMAVLGFFVADLLLHSEAGQNARRAFEELQTALEKAQSDLLEKARELLGLESRVQVLEGSNKELQLSLKSLEGSNKELQGQLESLGQAHKAAVQQAHETTSLLQWLMNSNKPFVWDEGQFRILPEPKGERRLNLQSFVEKFDILASCLQARVVTATGADMLGREKGTKFSKEDYGAEVVKLLKAMEQS